VLFVNVPGSTPIEYEKCFELLIPVTVNVPLYAEFAAPARFCVLVTLTTFTSQPIERSCGSSVIIFAEVPSHVAFAIIL